MPHFPEIDLLSEIHHISLETIDLEVQFLHVRGCMSYLDPIMGSEEVVLVDFFVGELIVALLVDCVFEVDPPGVWSSCGSSGSFNGGGGG